MKTPSFSPSPRPSPALPVLLGAAAAALWLAPAADAASVVIPDGAAEGNASAEGPFAPLGQRYQQVFAAEGFGDAGPLSVSAVAFRADADATGPIDTTRGVDGFPVEVRLWTTSRAPDGLSSLFDDNVGADSTTVFSGTLSFSSPGPDASGPGPFDLGIAFDRAFTYDPAAGNLLLEVVKFSADLGEDPLLLDAADDPGDGTSSLGGLSPIAAQGALSSLGLIAQFEVNPGGPDPIPTPTAAGLGLALGLASLARRRTATTPA